MKNTIQITNTKIYNFYDAIYGIRLNKNTIDKIDSSDIKYKLIDSKGNLIECYNFIDLGNNDKLLIEKLCNPNLSRNSHRKFLRQIFVNVHLTLPLYIWSELDTYKIATVRNSASTMNSLSKINLSESDFMRGSITKEQLNKLISVIKEYNNSHNILYKKYKKSKMKKLLPSGFLLESVYTCNYQTLKDIYHDRKNHELPEWKKIIKWIESLPYADILIL